MCVAYAEICTHMLVRIDLVIVMFPAVRDKPV